MSTLKNVVKIMAVMVVFCSVSKAEKFVKEGTRKIPVAYNVDVVVVGGTSAGVTAALEAAKQGASVFLMASQSYVGEDICGTYRLWLEPNETPVSDLAKQIYTPRQHSQADSPAAMAGQYVPTPMHVKRTLEQALIAGGVQFLFNCYPTDILRDKEGKPAGVVMANRAGRQAVVARVIIDATQYGTVARIANVCFEPFAAGKTMVKRVVVGGQPCSGDGILSWRKVPAPDWNPALEKVDKDKAEKLRLGPPAYWDRTCIEYTLEVVIKDYSYASLARAEHKARDMTWSFDQMDASEFIFHIPSDRILSGNPVKEWNEAGNINLGAFKTDYDNLYVLSGCAAVSRDVAERMLRPLAYMEIGRRVGKSAADTLNGRAVRPLADIRIEASGVHSGTNAGKIKELLNGIRPTQSGLPVITSQTRAIPVIGEYDVVVVGGGTGGAPAGISAARSGAKTLVIEKVPMLGGVGTIGLIGIYYFGNLDGFTAEMDKAVLAMSEKSRWAYHANQDGTKIWNIEIRAEWLRRELLKAGGDIWFNTIGCGALVENGTVKGVVVATPMGRGVVLTKKVIDGTGSSDIAIAAGAKYVFVGAEEAAMQGTGLPFRNLYSIGTYRLHWYANTDYTFVDDSDMLDVWRTFVAAREKFSNSYDVAQLIDSRERRRIVGDFTLSPLDIINNRTYEDSIELARSNLDTHGFTIHPIFMLRPPDHNVVTTYVPYRCLLPKGLEGVLVIGLGISAHRDAMPMIRMQPDIQNQGYAAGLAAAMAAKEGKKLRQIDIKKLQKLLVEKGCLPAGVLTDKDSYPYSKECIAKAVKNIPNGYQDISMILAQLDDALPMLRDAYKKAASEQDKIVYAHVLGTVGDATGAETLLKVIESSPWDKGWNFRAGGQFGNNMSLLDSMIMAMGRTGSKKPLNALIEKTRQLDAESEFSHHRAVAVVFESIADRRAAQPLAELLEKPGMTGYALKISKVSSASELDTDRMVTLREIILARALYRCGDWQGIGEKILRQYRQDPRGLYSRHADIVLQKKRL